MNEFFAACAVVLGIAGNIPYVRDILRGRVQPHAYTWFVWSIVSGITLFGQIAKGAGIGAAPTAVAELFTIGIFFLSLRYGLKDISRTDSIYLVVALCGIGVWYLTNDPTYSVMIAVSIDVIAFVPTLRRARAQPPTETPLLYGSNVVRHIFSLASLEAYNVATTLHSIAMLVMNSTMVTMLLVFRRNARLVR